MTDGAAAGMSLVDSWGAVSRVYCPESRILHSLYHSVSAVFFTVTDAEAKGLTPKHFLDLLV